MTVDKTEPDLQTISPDVENEEKPNNSESNEETAPASEEKELEPEWQDVLGSGSLMKKVLTEGNSKDRPYRQTNCVINYDLTLADGTFVQREENLRIQIGDNEVVQGLDVGIPLMYVGEISRFKIEPRLAFGAIGLPPNIPPNADVVFDVELLSATEEDSEEMLPIEERKFQGNKKRERGNWWYGRGENSLAIQCYRRALNYLEDVESGLNLDKVQEITDADLQELFEMRMSVLNNMAAAQIKLELYDAALASLEPVLNCQPSNVKAIFRKAKVYRAKNNLQEALKCLKKADEVSPNNPDVQKEIFIVNKLIQKDKVKERELARRMFGDKKANVKEEKNEAKHSMLMWSATLAASFAVGLVGVAFYRLKFS